MLDEVWTQIEVLRARNARHRRGWRMQDATVEMAVTDLHREMVELADAPDDMDELADVIVVAFHYAQIQGWTRADLVRAAMDKLAERFE